MYSLCWRVLPLSSLDCNPLQIRSPSSSSPCLYLPPEENVTITFTISDVNLIYLCCGFFGRVTKNLRCTFKSWCWLFGPSVRVGVPDGFVWFLCLWCWWLFGFGSCIGGFLGCYRKHIEKQSIKYCLHLVTYQQQSIMSEAFPHLHFVPS